MFQKLATLRPVSLRFMSTAALPTPPLITASDALGLRASTPGQVKFVDGSFYLNKDLRNAFAEYSASRIPNAQFIDIDSEAFSDKSTSLPHMMPSAEKFSHSVSRLGISSSDHVIVYTARESFSASRVWWMFKAFGHEKVSILNGGLSSWCEAGGEVVEGTPTEADAPAPGVFEATLNPKLVVDWNEVLSIVNSGTAQIADARSGPRFRCEVDEPRAGLPRGQIPGSLNIPFTSIVQDGDVTKFRPWKELQTVFRDAGVIPGSRVVTTCGSGVTAAVITFGRYLCGAPLENTPVYDGESLIWSRQSFIFSL